VLAASATDCEDAVLTQPFLPWLDPINYKLVPDGGFENGAAGWQLTGGAAVVDGNEPWRVRDAADGKSLSLPAGATATSRATCAGLDHLVMRFFAKRGSTSLLGSLTSSLGVEVLYEDGTGAKRALPLVSLTLGSSWSPGLPVPVVANLLPLLPGEQTPLAFRFTARGASFRIDDVYLDPSRRS